MSGFFARMAERGAGTERVLRLRPPQRFEAAPLELDATAEGAAAPPAAVAAPPPPEAATPAVVPAAPRVVAPPPEARPEPAALEAAAPVPVERAVPIVPPPPAVAPPAAPPREEPEAPASEPTAAPAEPRSPSPEPEPVAVEAPRAPPPPPPAPPPAREPPPRRRPTRAPEVDVVTLLREHVVPVLVERGYVRRAERPVVRERPAASARPPSPGTISVTPDAVELDAAEAEPQVNLNIGRIVVTRAAAPAPSAPAPPRQTVDHEAYLARREARR